MGKHKRIITFLLAVLFSLQPFLACQEPVKAVAPLPSPTGACKLVSTENKYQIQCTPTAGGKVLKFEERIASDTTVSDWGEVDSDLSKQLPTSFGIHVKKPNKVYDDEMVFEYVLAINTQYAFFQGNPILAQYKCGADKHNCVMSDLTPANQADIKALQSLQTSHHGEKISIPDRGKPNSATIAQCSKLSIKPISKSPGGMAEMVKTMKDKMIAEVTSSVGAGAENAANLEKAKNAINDIFDNPENVVSGSQDLGYYHTYYATDENLGYPNIEINQNKISLWTTSVEKLSELAPGLNFDAMQHYGVVGKLISTANLTSGQTAGVGIGVGVGTVLGAAFASLAAATAVAAVGGAATGTLIGLGIASWITGAQNYAELKSIIRQEVRLTVAYSYIKQNLLYNECASKAGDTNFAKFSQAMMDRLNSNFNSAGDAANQFAAADENKTVCDSVKGNAITAMFGTAFCGMILILKGWADSAYLWSIKLMAASIGLDSGDYGITVPAGETGVDGAAATADPATNPTAPGTGETTQTTLEKAIAFCNTKKPAETATEAVKTAWKQGPCISPNYESTGYAIDIAHNPRSNAVDNANVCAGSPAKFIELDLTCAKIRMVPEEAAPPTGDTPNPPPAESGSITLQGTFKQSGAATAAQKTLIAQKLTNLNNCAKANSGCTPKAKIQAEMKDKNGNLQLAGTAFDGTITFTGWDIIKTNGVWGNMFTAKVVGSKKFNGTPDGVSITITYGGNSIRYGAPKTSIGTSSGAFFTDGS